MEDYLKFGSFVAALVLTVGVCQAGMTVLPMGSHIPISQYQELDATLRRLTTELHLTRAQKIRARVIFERFLREVAAAEKRKYRSSAQWFSAASGIFYTEAGRFRRTLDAGQRKKFDRLMARQRVRLEELRLRLERAQELKHGQPADRAP